MSKVEELQYHRRTIADSIHVAGKALHLGGSSTVTLHPAASGTGIRFSYQKSVIKASLDNLGDLEQNTTILQREGVVVMTTEHLLSGLYGLGITDCDINLQTQHELPVLDGSARDWCAAIQKVGIRTLRDFIKPLIISREHKFICDQSEYSISPYDSFVVEGSIDFANTVIGKQTYFYEHSIDNYIYNIAFARTFIRDGVGGGAINWTKVKERLRGLDTSNVQESPVIIYQGMEYLTPLRIPDEPVRHKILDFIGDLSLIGRPIKGYFKINRPGHKNNLLVAKSILREYT